MAIRKAGFPICQASSVYKVHRYSYLVRDACLARLHILPDKLINR